MRLKSGFLLSLLVFAGWFLASPVKGLVKPDNAFRLPDTAKPLSDTLYYLGKAKDDKGREVEGFAFVHRKGVEARVKPGAGGGPSCFGFMARGARWKNVESWVVNASNSRGLSSAFVLGNLTADVGKWNGAAGKTVIGSGSTTVDTLAVDTVSPDNKNEVYFADVVDPGAIAVTSVWGIFSGQPQNRELVEWDQVYDDYDYDWSADGEAGKMDFENIATHELGHSVGMDDIYDSACSSVSMYGYADYGETDKRTLETPDKDGVRALYK